MAKGFIGASGCKAYLGAVKMRKGYIGATRVYSAGNIVTYHVDTGVTCQEEVDEGESCLSPKTFTPSKSGWEFVGWRQDTAANGSVLSSKVMDDGIVTLYAVFRKAVTVTYYNNSATASSTSGYRYYNNGNVVNPSFTLTQAAKSGWTVRGWSTSTAGNGSIAYSNATAFTRNSNVTLYGMYYQTITLTYYNGSTTASSTSGTRYYNSGTGNAVNPIFTLTPAALSGWTFRGWATSSAATAGIAYSSISGTAFAASTTIYAAYSQTITLSYNGNGSTGGSTATQTGTRYWNTGNESNPSFKISANGFSKTGYNFSKWAINNASGTQYAPGDSVTLGANTQMFAVWTRIITPYTWVTNYMAASGQSLVIDGSGQGLSRSLPTGTFNLEDVWDAVAMPNFSVYTNKVDVSGLTKMSIYSAGGTSLLYYGGLNGGTFTVKSDKGDLYNSPAQINGDFEVDITGADWIQILATASTHNKGSGGIMLRIREIKFS